MSVQINSTNPDSGSATANASGDKFIIHNPRGRMYLTVEEIFAGAPTSVSVTIQGQMPSGTVDTVLDTNTSASASMRSPSITKPYSAFLVTATWSGGTKVTATFNWQFGGTS